MGTPTYELDVLWRPLKSGAPTQSGFSSYRQCPTYLLGRNLVNNGGFMKAGSAWTLNANAVPVADSGSPSGYALSIVATAAGQSSTQNVTVEDGKTYRFAVQMRGDGTAAIEAAIFWYDSGGNFITQSTISGAITPATTYAEYASAALVAPGNARTAQIIFYPQSAGSWWVSAVRCMQQSTAPAAWVSTHQQYRTQGLEIYEAGTNLLANGDIETALTGSVVGFDETFATLNAWTATTLGGASGGAFTVASNVVSGVASAIRAMYAGHAEWWDSGSTSCVLRFLWRTGGTIDWWFRWDGNAGSPTGVRCRADGANLKLDRVLAGTAASEGSVAAALADNTWYWFDAKLVGNTVTLKLFADSPAGTKSATQVGTTITAVDAALILTGKTAVVLNSSTNVLKIGGAATTPNPCQVTIPTPGTWVMATISGTPAYCVSKTNRFSGTYSLSIYSNNADVTAFWSEQPGNANVQHTLSGRQKTSGVTGTRAGIQTGAAEIVLAQAGTNDWSALAGTAVIALNSAIDVGIVAASGTAWWDLVWLAAQAYDTGNSDLSGQAYVPTGARTASSNQLPLPSAFDITNFAMVGVVRLDHAYNRGGNDRIFASLYIDGNNRIEVELDPSSNVGIYKREGGTLSLANDSAATAAAAGDTIAWGVIFSTTLGLVVLISKNGGAVQTYTSTASYPTEGKLPLIGTAPTTMYLGRYAGAGGYEQDGTTGVIRMLIGGLSAATVSALVSDPYQVATDNDLAIWTFDGSVVESDLWINETANLQSFDTTRGRDYASQLTGKAMAGTLVASLFNGNNRYSTQNVLSPLSGNAVPGRKVRLLMGANTIWQGFLDEIKPIPGLRDSPSVAELRAFGPMRYVGARRSMTTIYTSIATGTATGAVLDDAGWSSTDRTIDTGQVVMNRWRPDNGVDALTAMRDLEETEGAFLSESRDGKLVYEDRNHRLVPPHTVSQASFSDVLNAALPLENVEQFDPLKEIYNRVEASVVPYVVQALATLWTLTGETPSIAAGATSDFYANYPTPSASTQADHVDAWTTPVATTDYTANTQANGGGTDKTAQIGVTVTKYANQMKISLKNNDAGLVYITFLQARGTPVYAQNPIGVASEDATSQTAYGKRTFPLPGKFYPSTTSAKSSCDLVLSLHKTPIPIVAITYDPWQSDAHATQAFTRDISDRISLEASGTSQSGLGLGISGDFFIESEQHHFDQGGHRVRYQLSSTAATGSYWTLGISQLGTGTVLFL